MSYHNSGGVCLPSPTHVHHVDVSSCVRQLRRSLSRSPSKWNLKSPSQSPTPSSSPKRTASNPSLSSSNNPPHTPSPLAVPFPPSKLALRSSTRSKTAPARPTARVRTSPKSPMKRALSSTSDSGNTSNTSSASSLSGQENVRSTSPGSKRKSFEMYPRMTFNLDVSAPVHQALSRIGGDASDSHTMASTSSPLKRSDAIMNLDQASLGSPVAKRRSLHGSASFGHDFNVFDHGPSSSPQFDIHDDSNHEYELSTASMSSENSSSPLTSMPRRSSSLRKSTLQQRHGEKTSWGRRHAAQLAQQLANTSNPEASTPVQSKNRPRLSLDQFMPPAPRDSPFSSQGSLPNASMHMVNQPSHQPHPLSRTMTTSSSSSSIVDDSPTPTHIPVNFGEEPRPKLDFSKSLPVGTRRPFHSEITTEEMGSFATPNYKAAKPLPTAFMSTGLISKVNRNPEELNVPRGNNKGNMPDTPCKKHVNIFATYPAQIPGSAIAKARHIRHSFGTPSTPFNGHPVVPGTFGKGNTIFGSAFGKLTRRGSFLSVDGDELCGSPDAKADSQNSIDFEMPPTPTKQALPHIASTGNHRGLSVSATHGGFGLSKKLPRMSTSPLERIDFLERLSPHTPRESMTPPDPSGLSISNPRDGQAAKLGSNATMPPPATPTAGRDYFSTANDRRLSTTPVSSFAPSEVDISLSSRFDKVEMVGTGEFSKVYRVTQPAVVATPSFFFRLSPSHNKSPTTPMPERVFAVKKSRQPFQGIRDRQRKLQEVEVLKSLGHSDHVVHFLDSWEDKSYLYIQTEFCEEGSLDMFIDNVGRKGKVDDFRVWKIMLELCKGLKHIHDSGYMHLDLKPANIFITFEGILKIGDFGMATRWPAQSGVDGEGDREYIGPEILLGQYDKPADIFALGLMMLEIAGNVKLPDNGPTWQRLRSGDVTELPSLTWSEDSSVPRDPTGLPYEKSDASLASFCSNYDIETDFGSPTLSVRKRNALNSSKSISPGNIFGSMRSGELQMPPDFMLDADHNDTIDNIIRWMIFPAPQDRPLIHQVLESPGLLWVDNRRRAGATVFEGNWGPSDEVLGDDAEMMDV